MPELAEVDYYRRQWDPGLGSRVLRIAIHPHSRGLRTLDEAALVHAITGASLVSSASHGKQMMFRLSRRGWLGVHLGMTGELSIAPTGFSPGRHDHLVLYQKERVLVFCDPRQFGRIRFHEGARAPDWWDSLPPAVTSPEFTIERLGTFLNRHKRAPIKAVLLSQECFPGIGNWMADEALWRAGVDPRLPSGQLGAAASLRLHRALQTVCAGALRVMKESFRDPPASWLFRHRWQPGGRCPKHHVVLERETVGGRATAWCAVCQAA